MNVSWQQLACVVGGGALGTLARFWIALAFPSDQFPWGTTIVNLSGALMFGVLWGAFQVNSASKIWYLLCLSGFMGAYTTFSTWVFEVTSTAEQERWSVSIGHLMGHVVLGVGLVRLGLTIGRLFRLGVS